MTTVHLIVPVRNSINKFLVQRILELKASFKEHVDGFMFSMSDQSLHDYNRNIMVADHFLPNGADWLLMCDDDVFFPTNILKMMVDAEKNGRMIVSAYAPSLALRKDKEPVVTQITPTSIFKVADGRWNREDSVSSQEPYRVDGAGTGCIAIHRSVLEKMSMPYFSFVYDQATRKIKVGEDHFFCLKAKQELDVDTWYDPRFECGHMKEVVFSPSGFFIANLGSINRITGEKK
jgi:hypothetical protein